MLNHIKTIVLMGILCILSMTACTTSVNKTSNPKALSVHAPTQALSFNSSNKFFWRKTSDSAYSIIGSQDTLIWSEKEVDGDLRLHIEIESDSKNGQGGVIVYGNGRSWSKGCLIFVIANDYQAIKAHTIYKGVKILANRKRRLNFVDQKHDVTIEIIDRQAKLYVNEKKILSANLPASINNKGKIGLYKYHSRPVVTYSNILLQQENKTLVQTPTSITETSSTATSSNETFSPPSAVEPEQSIPSISHPQKRFALIIGNSKYKDAPLRNPVNDAKDVSKILKMLGFQVITKTNINQQEMEESVNQFFHQIRQTDVALFYFSGHGAQVNGENYLLPVEEQFHSETDIRYKSMNAGYILGKMEESGSRTNVLILDACRNNPFKGFRSLQRGLTIMSAPVGSFIAYATAPGTVALDGTERNGIYTKYLLQALQRKGLSIEQLFKYVLRGVEQETNGKQIPWTSSSLREEFYFRQ